MLEAIAHVELYFPVVKRLCGVHAAIEILKQPELYLGRV